MSSYSYHNDVILLFPFLYHTTVLSIFPFRLLVLISVYTVKNYLKQLLSLFLVLTIGGCRIFLKGGGRFFSFFFHYEMPSGEGGCRFTVANAEILKGQD